VEPGTTIFSPGGNLSGGGMYLHARSTVTQGAAVAIRFQIPYLGDMVEARGVVRWRQLDVREEETVGIGIEFLDLESPTRERILQYIEGQALNVL